MADTTYVDYVAPAVNAEWLNEINDHVWHDTPVSGTTVHDSSVIGFTQAGTGAVATTIQAKLGERVSVIDFGADPTGVSDSTAAFNLATKSTYASTGNNDLNFPSEVIVPAGQYRISGIVYVHKGQHLKGMGEGATRILLDTTTSYANNIFKLGYSTAGADAGGLPPEISGMWLDGGPSSYAAVFCDVAGFTIHNLFLTNSGTGIRATGESGRIHNIQMDQPLTAFIIGGQNILVSDSLVYSPNYGVTTVNGTGTTCSDITFSNVHFYYPKYCGVSLTSGVTHNSVAFNDCNFHMNAQSATFFGFVAVSCNSAKNVTFNDCVFSNMYGPAYKHIGGIDNKISFNDCVFDGNKTVSGYAQSTTAYAAYAVNDELQFNDCEFNNLLAEPISVDGSVSAITRVYVRGGLVSNCAGSTLFAIGATAPSAGSALFVNDVIYRDQSKQAFPVSNGWFMATDNAQVLTGNGATTITQYPTGHNSVYFVDTTSTTATVRLPLAADDTRVGPKHGDKLTFIDYAQSWNTNNVTFLRGDNTINGAASDYVATVNGDTVTFTYNSVTSNWNVTT